MNRLPRWGVILIAFAISLSLWAFLFVRSNPTNSQVKSGVLVVKNLAPNLVVVDETGRRLTTFPVIEARIFAAQSAFGLLPAAGLTFYVDVADKGPGEYELPVQVDWLAEWGYFRSEIRAEQQVVTIRLEEVISKVFVPEIETTGLSSDAIYNRSSILADPATEVVVSGPQTLVNQVEGIRLRFAYNASQMGSTESIVVVPVNTQGEQVFGVESTPSQVDVIVRVEPKFGIRSVVIRPNVVGLVESGYEITSIVADPPTVAIQGDVQTISNTTAIETEAILVTGLTQSITQTVALNLNNVSLVDATNTTAQVRIEIAPIERNTRMRLFVPIEIRDVPEGFVFASTPTVYVLDVIIEPEALRRNAIGLVQAFVSVGEWDSAQPGRQVQVLLPANILRESELTFVNIQQIAPPIETPEVPPVDETATTEAQPDENGDEVVTPTALIVAPTMTPTPLVGD